MTCPPTSMGFMTNGIVELARTRRAIVTGDVMSSRVQVTVRPVSRSKDWMRSFVGFAWNACQSMGSDPSRMASS